jgi:uncharacterized protein (TIGR03086 family)
MTALLAGVSDARLDARTPCPDYSLGDLVEHVGGLAVAFRSAAAKELGEFTSQAPQPSAARLGADWRVEIPRRLDALAEAWRKPDAWSGMTQAGGVDLPGPVAGMVALNELTLHGWDIAVASGQEYAPSEEELAPVLEFLTAASAPDQAAAREGLFGPVVEVPADAPTLDRVLGLSGRSPHWRG